MRQSYHLVHVPSFRGCAAPALSLSLSLFLSLHSTPAILASQSVRFGVVGLDFSINPPFSCDDDKTLVVIRVSFFMIIIFFFFLLFT